jgi:hypothetical protein
MCEKFHQSACFRHLSWGISCKVIRGNLKVRRFCSISLKHNFESERKCKTQTWYILNYPPPPPPTKLSRRDKAVGTVTGYGLNDRRASWSPSRARFFSSPECAYRFLVTPGFLCNGYRGRFSWGNAVGASSPVLIPTNAKIKDTLRRLHRVLHTTLWLTA